MTLTGRLCHVKPSLTPIQSRQNRQSYARTQTRHPLLGAFPLLVMTLAAILVLFTLAMAQLRAGSDPDLAREASSSLVAKVPAHTP
jgi:hypothetical protein